MSVDSNFKVQMGACGQSGRSHACYSLPPHYALATTDENARAMAIYRGDSSAVVDHDHIAKAAHLLSRYDDPAVCCINRCAARRTKIDPGMQPPDMEDRMKAHPESTRNRP